MSCFVSKEEAILAFALKDQEVADYHYRFYHLIAELVADHRNDEARRAWNGLLREELSAKANGEVDEESWTRKQKLQRQARPMQNATRSCSSDYSHGSRSSTP